MSNKIIHLYDLKEGSYQLVWDLQRFVQEKLIEEKRAELKGEFNGIRKKDALLFVEHPHVYTLGKSGAEEHMLRSMLELQQLSAEFVKIDRGGDITYHGPGQIVGYPILDLDRYFTDIHKYLRFLEQVIINVCEDYGLYAQRIEGLTGVWIGEKKIAALGIRSSRWVTMHGFGFNVNTDLSYFGHIVPCGISDKAVTSLHTQLGMEIDSIEVKHRIIYHFEKVFDVSIKSCGGIQELKEYFS
jgi:lipoyl(octanoyl) transferase